MKGIVITTENEMSVKDFTRPLHESVGAVVSGWIELVNPRGLCQPYCMIVNEEGLIAQLDFNTVGSFLYQTYIHGSPILGNIVIMKHGFTEDGPDIVGLDDEDLSYLTQYIRKIYPVKETKTDDKKPE